MSDNGSERERAHGLVEFWLRNKFAIAWTVGNSGDEAKKCRTKGWHETPPLAGERGALAGQVAERLKTRNPVVVARNSGLVLVDADGAEQVERFLGFGAPSTLTACSSGDRRHFYYRLTGVAKTKFAIEGPVVTASANGYLVTVPALHPGGDPYRWFEKREIAELPLEIYKSLLEAADAGEQKIRQALEDPGAAIEHPGREPHLFKAACALRRMGLPEPAALRTLQELNEARCVPPRERSVVAEKVQNAYRRYPDGVPEHGEPVTDPEYDVGEAAPTAGRPTLDHDGMAQLLVWQYGDRFRHVFHPEGWIHCRGGRWYEKGSRRLIEQAAIRVLRDLPQLAERLPAEDDYREALLKFASRARSRELRNAMIDLSRSEPAMLIDHERLDRHPMLLACRNGTLDLESGKLREHDPRDFLTRGTGVVYDPQAKAPRWERFLREIFLDDEELISYMQRVCGYCLTGDIREEQMWIFYGAGGNGKSKFCAPWRKVLGRELAQMATFSTFTYNPNSDRHPTDLAAMDRARLVVASEKHRAKPLDESVIKNLTGGEPIRARYMRQDFFEYDPQFKLWFCVNDKPPVNADAAIKRRVRMVPFAAEFSGERQDVNLEKKLLAEAEGILAWAVRGCRLWLRDGLQAAAAVERTTDEYMAEMNPLTLWIEQCCELDRKAATAGAELRDSYKEWCAETGTPRLSDSDYGQALAVLGLEKVHGRTGKGWRGIRLK